MARSSQSLAAFDEEMQPKQWYHSLTEVPGSDRARRVQNS